MNITTYDQDTVLVDTPNFAVPQIVRWGPSDGLPAGIWINSKNGQFIPWKELVLELKSGLLNQLGRHISLDCDLTVRDLFGRKDWIVRIVNKEGEDVGSLWFGGDRMKDWAFDGKVRAGEAHSTDVAEVWQTFERYSDGTYRRVS